MKVLHFSLSLAFAVGAALAPFSAKAAFAPSTPGIAVTSVDASADFESIASLTGNPYLEGGLSFSRTGLSFSNNGCGFASSSGCATNFPSMVGNYMYGAGAGGYFEITATGGDTMTGIEFLFGLEIGGFPDFERLNHSFAYRAFLAGSSVGFGDFETLGGVVLAFVDPSGFDRLVITSKIITPDDVGDARIAGFHPFSNNTPAFDSVRVQFAVPEPATLPLVLSALAWLGFTRRRRRISPSTC